jgi:hypothetical protein
MIILSAAVAGGRLFRQAKARPKTNKPSDAMFSQSELPVSHAGVIDDAKCMARAAGDGEVIPMELDWSWITAFDHDHFSGYGHCNLGVCGQAKAFKSGSK